MLKFIHRQGRQGEREGKRGERWKAGTYKISATNTNSIHE